MIRAVVFDVGECPVTESREYEALRWTGSASPAHILSRVRSRSAMRAQPLAISTSLGAITVLHRRGRGQPAERPTSEARIPDIRAALTERRHPT